MPEIEPFIGDFMFQEVIPRMEEYFLRKKLSVKEQLGYGKDGLVYSTTAMTVVKGLNCQGSFEDEKRAYKILDEANIYKIGQFNVPRMLESEDNLLIIEMTQVTPPFIVDFVGTRFPGQTKYQFDEETLQIAYEEQKENFGEDWECVQSALSELRSHGIYLSDINPKNICCHRYE